MDNKLKQGLLVVFAILLAISGCSKESSNDIAPAETVKAKASISSATATSNHYVEVALSSQMTQAELADLPLTITSGTGKKLEIVQKSLSENGESLILQTDGQIPGLYKLRLPSENTSNKPTNIQRGKISSRAEIDATYDFVDFDGSIEPEPYIETVIATSNTTLLITMSDEMEKASVEKTPETLTSAYRVVAADNGRPRADVGDLLVTGAELDPSDPDERRIILTTTQQFDIEYFVTVANIYSAPPGKLIHPARNKMSFFGIAETDTTPPRMTNVISTGNTSVLVTFSEPLSDVSVDPINFTICTVAFDPVTKECPSGNELRITNSVFNNHKTQVELTTEAQLSGIDYNLKVKNVFDRSTPAPGNEISGDDNDTIGNFIGSGKGAPQVKSALAISNTEVLVTFSERMSDDVTTASSYHIELPPLDVYMVERGDDAWTVKLTTSEQARQEYTVTVRNVQSAEGLLIDSDVNQASFVGIAAKDTDAPQLVAALAESTATTLYFSEALNEAGATDPRNYAISYCPEGEDCVADATKIINIIPDAAILTSFNTQVIMIIKPLAPRVEHTVVVSNVTDTALPLPHNTIDPAKNTATFGILLDDKDNPKLTAVTITDIDNILLSFNEAMGENAEDPTNYLVCTVEINDGACPPESTITVLGAQLSGGGTQVVLQTPPLTDGDTYYVAVNPDVADTTGNKIDTSTSLANVTYKGATSVSNASKLPAVVGAISTSNTSITVSFNAAMGTSAVNLQNYVVAQEDVNGEAGTIFITKVDWVDDSFTAVKLTTTSQNEVTYRITVVNVKDVFGNSLDNIGTQGVHYNPISAVFAGSPATFESFELISGSWTSNGEVGKITSGDTITFTDQNDPSVSSTIVLIDTNLDGSVDNWIDNNDDDIINDGDLVSGMIDTDGDGLSDSEELRGRIVTIYFSDGTEEKREVTSDPTKADTDNDGLSDLVERTSSSNPRSSDTDSDGLSDALEWNVIFSSARNQDSDGDGLSDGGEHSFFHTSPNLADTDGDQLTDAQEIVELNRNPRIADLPKLKIEVGQVNLQIDERFTYEDSEGETVTKDSSSSASLSSSIDTSFSNSQTTTDEIAGGFAVGLQYTSEGTFSAGIDGGKPTKLIGGTAGPTFEISGNFQRTTSTAMQISTSSAKSSQESYASSLSKGTALSENKSTTRELLAARMSVDLQVENVGNLAMTVKNLQVTVLQVDPQNRNKRIPIATLTAETGDLEINLGPFSKSKGPFIFSATDVYPNLIEELMRDPRSLVFKVSNYDIVDEYDRNFAFANQVTRDRTAGVIFDFGELGSEGHYVATSGALLDSDENEPEYVGGFGDAGKPKTITLSYLLQNVLGIAKHDSSKDYFDNGRLRNPYIRTGIIAGDNKIVDSLAQGDDIQLVPYGSTGVPPKQLIIDPGANDVLDTPLHNNDLEEFISGYETKQTCGIGSAAKEVGNFCIAAVGSCSCNGPEHLYRVKTFRHGDFNNSWFVRTNADVPAAANFDDILVGPGEDIRMSFLQDLDRDGLFAHEEFLFGSTDSRADIFDNSQYLPNIRNGRYFEKTASELATPDLNDDGLPDGDGLFDSIDSDHDGISDFVEAKLGWLISRNGELKRVFSHPGLVDSDSDTLWDVQEQDLREFCANNDSRLDALCAHLAKPKISQLQATAIIAGKNRKLDVTVEGDDVYAMFPLDHDLNSGLLYGTAVILPGENGVIDTVVPNDDENQIDDRYSNASVTLPATDPLLADTDSDNVDDGPELFGYAAAMSIIEGAETESLVTENNGTQYWGFSETPAQGDDIQRVSVNGQTKLGVVLITAGANGILETVPKGNDKYTDYWFIAPGEDRRLDCAIDANAATDTNGDGVADTVSAYEVSTTLLDPYAPAIWSTLNVDDLPDSLPVEERIVGPSLEQNDCAVELSEYDDKNNPGKDLKLYGRIVVTDPLRRDTEGDRIPDGFEVAVGSDPTIIDSANFRDTDFDGLSDIEEQVQGWVVKINDSKVGYLVRSNPARPDSDFDGLPDFVERDIGTDPHKPDTDNDGLDDWQEFRSVTRYNHLTDVNGDGVLNKKDEISQSFSVDDYSHLSSLFTGFNLTVNDEAYNTDPLLTDSDYDRISDFEEVVTGYRILATGGNFLGPVVLTDPNNWDTDGDGLSDYEEKNGFKIVPDTLLNIVDGEYVHFELDNDGNYLLDANGSPVRRQYQEIINTAEIPVVDHGRVTDASVVDTDGDGRSDFVELDTGSLTNPLVPDANITVAYESIFTTDINDCSTFGADASDNTDCEAPEKTDLFWWFYATDGNGNKHLLSASDEYAYNPKESVIPVGAGQSKRLNTTKVQGLKMSTYLCENGMQPNIDYTECSQAYFAGDDDPEYLKYNQAWNKEPDDANTHGELNPLWDKYSNPVNKFQSAATAVTFDHDFSMNFGIWIDVDSSDDVTNGDKITVDGTEVTLEEDANNPGYFTNWDGNTDPDGLGDGNKDCIGDGDIVNGIKLEASWYFTDDKNGDCRPSVGDSVVFKGTNGNSLVELSDQSVGSTNLAGESIGGWDDKDNNKGFTDGDFISGMNGIHHGDYFRVVWEGQLQIDVPGDYQFQAFVDDGWQLTIDGKVVATRFLFQSADNSSVTVNNMKVGSHSIRIDYFEHEGPSVMKFAWAPPGSPYVAIPLSKLSYEEPLFSCIGIERDPKKSSFIPLARDKSQLSSFETRGGRTGDPFYGSVSGSELDKFCDAVDKGKSISDDLWRFYVSDVLNTETEIKTDVYVEDELLKVAYDLAASRNIIKNLVSPIDDDRNISDAQQLKSSNEIAGENIDWKYFDLLVDGRNVYQQYCANEAVDRLGQHSFVLNKGESFNVEGMLLKVNPDDLADLRQCPLGSPDVATEFTSSCIKRFSRSFTYTEAVAEGNSSYSLQDLSVKTFSTTGLGVTGCEIDVTTTISNN